MLPPVWEGKVASKVWKNSPEVAVRRLESKAKGSPRRKRHKDAGRLSNKAEKAQLFCQRPSFCTTAPPPPRAHHKRAIIGLIRVTSEYVEGKDRSGLRPSAFVSSLIQRRCALPVRIRRFHFLQERIGAELRQ
ncbi:UNVERIFIED_CONTAM: hypothetical protein K2H54_008125 [Gekko kuhli]